MSDLLWTPPKSKARTTDDDFKYLLLALKHAQVKFTNYRALAEETGATNASNAQKRVRALVERSGEFKLINGVVVAAADASSTTAVRSPEGRSSVTGKKTAATSAAKSTPTKPKSVTGKPKPAATDEQEDDDGESEVEDEDPVRLGA